MSEHEHKDLKLQVAAVAKNPHVVKYSRSYVQTEARQTGDRC